MQLNLVNLLVGAPTAAAPAEKAAEDGVFAQLLGDAATGQGGQGGGKGAALPGGELAAAALVAQELDPAQLVSLQGASGDKLAKLLGQTIGPEEATALLEKIGHLLNDHGNDTGKDPAFSQLKEALEEIELTGEPVEVADLLADLPQVADAEKPAERAPVLQRLLGWMQAAMDKHKESSQVSLVPDGTAQSLQASLFSARDDAPATTQAPAEASANVEKANAITQVTGIPATVSAVSAVPKIDENAEDVKPTREADSPDVIAALAASALPAHDVSTTKVPEWVHKLAAGEQDLTPEAINEAIPSLALEDGEEGLPVVDLPGSDEIAEAFAKPAHEKKAATLRHAASESFQLLASQANNEPPAAPVVTLDANAHAIAPLHGVNPNSHGTVNPITITAHGHLTPHVAASEQVQVAITTATKDGVDKITLQLEPADLGRVEIKMDMSVEGRTQLSFLVDKAETLEQLARDARSLERALQEAGIKSDAGSMQFNLRQQNEQQEFANPQGGGSKAANDNDETAALGSVTKHYTLNVREGVDIHA